MKIYLDENNNLVAEKGGRKHYVAIPSGNNRVDFIDSNWNYHYNYSGITSDGILITILDSDISLEFIKGMNRKWRNLKFENAGDQTYFIKKQKISKYL